ncbi:MAG: hypothetical protein GF317_24545, partial [Candidatus Lokiarchaeota archaeon]|nr:hypothetical protein [Candidatus Lokiarchaeota archaeon]
MNRNRKILVALLALLIITIPAGILSWVFFFRESAPGQPDLKYADIMISNHSLENEILTFTVKNQGEENANGIEVVVQIESLALVLYDNSLNPLDLAASGTSEIQINLTEYFSCFRGRFIYSIDLEIDPDDLIEELSEVNNFITIDYTFAPEGMILPNTYTYNSTIENLGYAIKFHENQILLENSLNISKGHINGYSLVNSTVLNSSTLLNPESKVSIALYGNQNLTLKNIWDISLSLMVFNNASVLLENSSIYDIQSFGNTSINLNNSTVMYFITSGTENDKGLFSIKNNSSIDLVMNRVSSEMEIESSSLSNIILQPNPSLNLMEEFDITGEITDSTIDSIGSFGQINFLISHTNITSVSFMGNSKATFQKCILSSLSSAFSAILILNESQVLKSLTYGIIVSSGSVNITNGEIQGDYLNTTTLINSNVSDSSYNSITVNGTGQLSITNYSSNIFLYDSAQLMINESSINSTAKYTCFIQDSAEIVGNNCSIETLLAYGDARIDLDNKSFVNLALLNNSNENDIRDTVLSQLILISDNQNGEPSRFTNCSI